MGVFGIPLYQYVYKYKLYVVYLSPNSNSSHIVLPTIANY